MNQRKQNLKIFGIVVIIIVLLDQILKIWVKTHMYIGESSYTHWGWKIKWFQIYFVENPGMAFGMQLPTQWGKLILTFFRILIISFLGYYIFKIAGKNVKKGYIVFLAMIFAGALGNLIDSMFYGVFFSDSPYVVYRGHLPPAHFCLHGCGYAPFFMGKVVDMLYFPLFKVHLPEWFPIYGGTSFIFFEPVFNIADASITVGTILLILFSKNAVKNFPDDTKDNDANT